MTEEFCLSDKTYDLDRGYPEDMGGSMVQDKEGEWINLEDVKEFIKKLKDILGIDNKEETFISSFVINNWLNKLAGDELI